MIERSGPNSFYHFQGLSKAEDKWVVSPNKDTIYLIANVSVRDGFKLVLPEVGNRFLSILLHPCRSISARTYRPPGWLEIHIHHSSLPNLYSSHKANAGVATS